MIGLWALCVSSAFAADPNAIPVDDGSMFNPWRFVKYSYGSLVLDGNESIKFDTTQLKLWTNGVLLVGREIVVDGVIDVSGGNTDGQVTGAPGGGSGGRVAFFAGARYGSPGALGRIIPITRRRFCSTGARLTLARRPWAAAPSTPVHRRTGQRSRAR